MQPSVELPCPRGKEGGRGGRWEGERGSKRGGEGGRGKGNGEEEEGRGRGSGKGGRGRADGLYLCFKLATTVPPQKMISQSVHG